MTTMQKSPLAGAIAEATFRLDQLREEMRNTPLYQRESRVPQQGGRAANPAGQAGGPADAGLAGEVTRAKVAGGRPTTTGRPASALVQDANVVGRESRSS